MTEHGSGFTETSYQSVAKRRRAQQILQGRGSFRQLEQAEVWAAQLTKDANWNVFLQVLAAQRKETADHLDRIEASELMPGTGYDPVGMATTRAAKQALKARLDTLDEVMALPKDIIEDGGIAREIVKKAEIDAEG